MHGLPLGLSAHSLKVSEDGTVTIRVQSLGKMFFWFNMGNTRDPVLC